MTMTQFEKASDKVQPGEERTKKTGLLVFALAFTGIIAAGVQTLVVPLIGQLHAILGTSASNAAWAVTITPLAAAVAIPVVGRLGDMYGKKKMILISAIPLLLGSIVCAMSGSLIPMIIGRGLQGFGMGLVPLGTALLREVVPAEKLGSAVATMSASMGIGGALGLPFAAAIAQMTSWRWMFWAFAALALIGLILVWRLVPRGAEGHRGGHFDWQGAILLGVGLTGLLLGISKGSDWGWGAPRTLVVLAVGAAVILVWVMYELRVSHPLANLRSLKNRTVALTNFASLFTAVGMYAQSLILPQLFQLSVGTGYGLGTSMFTMALWMAPAGIMMMIISPLGAKITARFGAKTTYIIAALVMAASYALAPLLMGSAWGLMLIAVICNIGTGLAFGAMPILIMGSVPASETASANGFNTLVRNLGTTIAAAVFGLVLSHMVMGFGGGFVPSLQGFHIAFAIASIMAVVAAVIAGFLPGKKRTPAQFGEGDAGVLASATRDEYETAA